MSIPYRTQQNLRRLAITLLTLLVVGVLVWGLWFLWLQRFVVYSRSEGAVLNFELPEELPPGEAAVEPEKGDPVEIYYNEGDDKLELDAQVAKLSGYFFERKQIYTDPAGAWERVQKLPTGTAVLMDMKNIKGQFYYSTDLGRPSITTAEAEGVDQLIDNLASSGYYTIARVPGLRDREFGLKYTNYGLPVSGGYLWMDSEGCYWLDPTKNGTIEYLTEIAEELRALGFREVVFEDYYFPDTERIIFKGDKKEALAKTAQTLVDNCATETFTVSFVSDGSWTPPTGNSRIYYTEMSNPAQITDLVKKLELKDPPAQMVFLTANTDNRFDEYGVLRPIDMAVPLA